MPVEPKPPCCRPRPAWRPPIELGNDGELRAGHAREDELRDAVAGPDHDAFAAAPDRAGLRFQAEIRQVPS